MRNRSSLRLFKGSPKNSISSCDENAKDVPHHSPELPERGDGYPEYQDKTNATPLGRCGNLRSVGEEHLPFPDFVGGKRFVPQGQHFINRRFQPTEGTLPPPQSPAGTALHLPRSNGDIPSVVPAGRDGKEAVRRLKPTVNNVLCLRHINRIFRAALTLFSLLALACVTGGCEKKKSTPAFTRATTAVEAAGINAPVHTQLMKFLETLQHNRLISAEARIKTENLRRENQDKLEKLTKGVRESDEKLKNLISLYRAAETAAAGAKEFSIQYEGRPYSVERFRQLLKIEKDMGKNREEARKQTIALRSKYNDDIARISIVLRSLESSEEEMLRNIDKIISERNAEYVKALIAKVSNMDDVNAIREYRKSSPTPTLAESATSATIDALQNVKLSPADNAEIDAMLQKK